jgi:hypothetical protein
MEADLVFLVAGVIGIVLGGLVAVAGVHTRESSNNAGNPILGNIIAALGLLVVVVSVTLGIVNLVIWATGRRRGNLARPLTDDEQLLQHMRDEGRGTSPPEPLQAPPARDTLPGQKNAGDGP